MIVCEYSFSLMSEKFTRMQILINLNKYGSHLCQFFAIGLIEGN